MKTDLDWLVGAAFRSITQGESDWVVTLGGEVTLTIQCLWRLTHGGRITITNEDDGEQFGLPEPLSASLMVNKLLSGASITAVELQEGTLDLTLKFDSGSDLQVLPISAGFEAWNLNGIGKVFVAAGGGVLNEFEI